MATGPIETHLHRSFNWENGAPGPREGQRGRSARCGNGLFAQCVRLRSDINPASIILNFFAKKMPTPVEPEWAKRYLRLMKRHMASTPTAAPSCAPKSTMRMLANI